MRHARRWERAEGIVDMEDRFGGKCVPFIGGPEKIVLFAVWRRRAVCMN